MILFGRAPKNDKKELAKNLYLLKKVLEVDQKNVPPDQKRAPDLKRAGAIKKK